MQVDSFTVLLVGLFLKGVLGALFVALSFRDRRATWYLWWSGTFLLGCAASTVFLLRGAVIDAVATGIGNGVLIMAFVCCWQAARAFDGRRMLWLPLLVPPGLWGAACFVPGFLDHLPSRIVLSSLLIAVPLAMAAVEFWRGREEPLPSRWPVIVGFASFTLLFAIRIPLIGVLPFPFGALPMEPGWLGAFNMATFLHTLVLTILVVSMTKERLELDQRTMAQTDSLTGALNRRAFMTRGTRLMLRHQIERAPLSLLFLDIDHFKSFNDRFGHSGGDDVLTTFVAVVHDNIRPTDFLFRIGGEEFCCLLPHTSTAQAHRVAERIRHRFEAATVDIAGAPVKATVSIGIASTEAFGYDIDTLMRRADMAVYAAKRQGRNKVAVASVDDAPGLLGRELPRMAG